MDTEVTNEKDERTRLYMRRHTHAERRRQPGALHAERVQTRTVRVRRQRLRDAADMQDMRSY